VSVNFVGKWKQAAAILKEQQEQERIRKTKANEERFFRAERLDVQISEWLHSEELSVAYWLLVRAGKGKYLISQFQDNVKLFIRCHALDNIDFITETEKFTGGTEETSIPPTKLAILLVDKNRDFNWLQKEVRRVLNQIASRVLNK